MQLLIVDDDSTIRRVIAQALKAAGHSVTAAADGQAALVQFERRTFDAVICDVRMPRVDGLALFRRVRVRHPDVPFILMTAHGGVSEAVEAVKAGAADYLCKPFEVGEMLVRVDRLVQRLWLEREIRRASAARDAGASRLVGSSPAMVALHRRIEVVARSKATVVICGESGTGKELVARAIHESSVRRERPFVAINCAAFPETLVEAELFGHARGAFTGALAARQGRFQVANRGTLLLDEVAEIPPSVQVKLLRVVQERTFEPVGSSRSIEVDVRLLCATHRNLRQRVREGRFREDLYYRLNVLDVHVPPLRQRRADIPALVSFFHSKLRSGEEPNVTPRAWAGLMSHAYPGNVRELEHAVHRAVVLAASGEIDLQHLPPDIAGADAVDQTPAAFNEHNLALGMRHYERRCLIQALSATGGRKAAAASLLGITRKTLWEKLRAHQLQGSESAAPPKTS